MRNRKIRLIVCLLLVTMMLAGCGGAGALVGRWANEDGDEIEFLSNGTCTSNGIGGGTYAVKGGKLEISAEGQTMTFDYKISGDTLTLTLNGSSIVFTKQK